MDVRFFLEQRLHFVNQLYTISAGPFLERKRLIEAEEEPYVPPYSEDGEPAFLSEWLEADKSLQVLGYACVSILSASFHLYLKTTEHQLRVVAGEKYKSDFKRGWFNGYRAYFLGEFDVDFGESQCDLGLLEELALARNRVQHPEWIASHTSRYSEDDLKKLPSPLFISSRDLELFSEQEERERSWLMPPSIDVTLEKFLTAISEVRRFTDWLESPALWRQRS
ncbi:hypothetical protein [Pseudomonas chlororaphis]|uniref:hypothetical protein n=1 Tax=Pseudomonas chlororaphis TaxID=587753 RepID=UPI00406BEAB0